MQNRNSHFKCRNLCTFIRIIDIIMKKNTILSICFCCCFLSMQILSAQVAEPMYKVNRYLAGGIGLTGTITNFIGLRRALNKDSISVEQILALQKEDVNSFDRYALRQNLDFVDQAKTLSDLGLYTTFFLPGLLFLDKEMGREWKDISLLYFQTQALSANVYSWSPLGPTFNERFRPGAYYDELEMGDRRNGRKRNSFFSGHVSTTATASFFMAKVYCDFHPDSKKWLVYTAALVPPAFVSLFRIKSLNHFPTDTIAGTLIGGIVGVLVPHIHRQKTNLQLGTLSNATGLALHWQF